jgi:7SK snRNA methylphosphate capping enzyme
MSQLTDSSIVLQIDRNVGEDPRLEAFNKQWFENKDCLDIGCNQGLVTIGLGNS